MEDFDWSGAAQWLAANSDVVDERHHSFISDMTGRWKAPSEKQASYLLGLLRNAKRARTAQDKAAGTRPVAPLGSAFTGREKVLRAVGSERDLADVRSALGGVDFDGAFIDLITGDVAIYGGRTINCRIACASDKLAWDALHIALGVRYREESAAWVGDAIGPLPQLPMLVDIATLVGVPF